MLLLRMTFRRRSMAAFNRDSIPSQAQVEYGEKHFLVAEAMSCRPQRSHYKATRGNALLENYHLAGGGSLKSRNADETDMAQACRASHLVGGRPQKGVGSLRSKTAQHVAHRVGGQHCADAQARCKQPC